MLLRILPHCIQTSMLNADNKAQQVGLIWFHNMGQYNKGDYLAIVIFLELGCTRRFGHGKWGNRNTDLIRFILSSIIIKAPYRSLITSCYHLCGRGRRSVGFFLLFLFFPSIICKTFKIEIILVSRNMCFHDFYHWFLNLPTSVTIIQQNCHLND